MAIARAAKQGVVMQQVVPLRRPRSWPLSGARRRHQHPVLSKPLHRNLYHHQRSDSVLWCLVDWSALHAIKSGPLHDVLWRALHDRVNTCHALRLVVDSGLACVVLFGKSCSAGQWANRAGFSTCSTFPAHKDAARLHVRNGEFNGALRITPRNAQAASNHGNTCISRSNNMAANRGVAMPQ